jgi:hypothetical protein
MLRVVPKYGVGTDPRFVDTESLRKHFDELYHQRGYTALSSLEYEHRPGDGPVELR